MAGERDLFPVATPRVVIAAPFMPGADTAELSLDAENPSGDALPAPSGAYGTTFREWAKHGNRSVAIASLANTDICGGQEQALRNDPEASRFEFRVTDGKFERQDMPAFDHPHEPLGKEPFFDCLEKHDGLPGVAVATISSRSPAMVARVRNSLAPHGLPGSAFSSMDLAGKNANGMRKPGQDGDCIADDGIDIVGEVVVARRAAIWVGRPGGFDGHETEPAADVPKEAQA